MIQPRNFRKTNNNNNRNNNNRNNNNSGNNNGNNNGNKTYKNSFDKSKYKFVAIVANKGGSLVGAYANGDETIEGADTFNSTLEGSLKTLDRVLDSVPESAESIVDTPMVIYCPDVIAGLDNCDFFRKESIIKAGLQDLAVQVATKAGNRLANIKLVAIGGSHAEIVKEAWNWINTLNSELVKAGAGETSSAASGENAGQIMIGAYSADQIAGLASYLTSKKAKEDFIKGLKASGCDAAQISLAKTLLGLPAGASKKVTKKEEPVAEPQQEIAGEIVEDEGFEV